MTKEKCAGCGKPAEKCSCGEEPVEPVEETKEEVVEADEEIM